MSRSHPNVDGKRLCTKCQNLLPVTAFNQLRRSATGLDYHCRNCRQSKKVDVYGRQAIKVSDVRKLLRQLIEDKSFTFVNVSKRPFE